MKSCKNEIKIDFKASAPTLFLAWLALIVIPSVVFFWSFSLLLKNGENHIYAYQRTQIYTEMENFRDQLYCESLLNNKLISAANSLGFSKSQNNHQQFANASQLHKQLEEKINLHIAATFYHGPDTATASYHISDKLQSNFLVSRTMVKTFFKTLNEQHKKVAVFAKNRINRPGKKTLELQISRADAFINALFQIAGDLNVKERETIAALSGKSDLGRIFFFYAGDEVKTDNGKANNGGFIVVIRENDIPLKQLLQFAEKGGKNSIFKRSYQTKDFFNETAFNKFNDSASKLEEDSASISLYEPFPDQFLLRLINRGTFFPFAVSDLINRFPLLKISVDKKDLQHPLRQFETPLKTAVLLVSLALGILLTRIYFFGLTIPLRLRGKIVAAIIAASALPIAALYSITLYHQNFIKDLQKFEIFNNFRRYSEQINFFVNAYRSKLENENAELGKRLETLELYEQIPYLKFWQKSRPVSLILTRIKRNDGVLLNEENVAPDPLEMQLKDFLFTSLENSLHLKEKGDPQNEGTSGIFGFKVKGIGLFLADIGMLHNALLGDLNSIYSLVPVFPPGQETVDSIFLIKYSTKKILQRFFANEPQFLQANTKNGFRLSKCFIPLRLNSELPKTSDFISSEGFPDELILERAKKFLSFKSQQTWQIKDSRGINTLIHANYLQSMQCIVFQVAQQVNEETMSFLPAPHFIFSYFLLIILVVFVYMGKAFIQPVRLLQECTEEIANGNFKLNLETGTGDEFDQLFLTYNHMIKGLNEREKLTSYLSKDVLTEISQENDILLPGGERAEVSIVFCSIPRGKELHASNDAEQILAHLGQLIDVADEISRNYQGVIDKVIEDTVMIVFRQSDAGFSHVKAACQTTLAIAKRFCDAEQLSSITAGIASGIAISGKIGSKAGKLDYTVIGNPVNLAARLKSQAHKASQTGILVCPQTIRYLKGAGKLNFIDRVVIKGRTRTFPMYELLGLRSD